MQDYPFHIGDGILVEYLAANEKLGIEKYLDAKQFKVADTVLSYRQINELDKDNLIQDERDGEKGWRKFSIFELIYLSIVSELKAYGVKHDKLTQLRDCFFKPVDDEQPFVSEDIARQAIGCAVIGAEIILSFSRDGTVAFYDPANYALFQNATSYIHINLNKVINQIRDGVGLEVFPIHTSLSSEYLKSRTLDVSKKEESILKAIRNKDYQAIRIKKSNGEAAIIYADRSDGVSDMTDADVLKIMKERDFQDVNVKRRNGKWVNLRVEETIKL